jgi:hypothetical protein
VRRGEELWRTSSHRSFASASSLPDRNVANDTTKYHPFILVLS